MASDEVPVNVTLNADGTGKIVLGNVDVSNRVDHVFVDMAAGRPSVLTISMPHVQAVIDTRTSWTKVAAEDEMVLSMLGWMTPEEATGWHAKLREASGMGDAAWPELVEGITTMRDAQEIKTEQLRKALGYSPEADWPTLVDAVRQLAARANGEVS
jgi:hypothetical protein